MLLNFFSFYPVPNENADDEFRDEVQHLVTIWQLDLLKVLIPCVFGKSSSPAGGAVSERVLKMLP